MLKHTLGHSCLFVGSYVLTVAVPESKPRTGWGTSLRWSVLPALNISSKISVWLIEEEEKLAEAIQIINLCLK